MNHSVIAPNVLLVFSDSQLDALIANGQFEEIDNDGEEVSE